MLKGKPNKPLALSALSLGAVGSCGQSYLLYHELADCLPYKVVHPEFYTSIATTGIWLVPLIAISVAALLMRRNLWLPLVLPVVLSPIAFACLSKVFTMAYGLGSVLETSEGGDFTVNRAAEQFYSYCFSLAITGTIIGLILAVGLAPLPRARKLP